MRDSYSTAYAIPDLTISSELGTPPRSITIPPRTSFGWGIGPDGTHIKYFRGIRNPIGTKVGPPMVTDELVTLLDSQCHVLGNAFVP